MANTITNTTLFRGKRRMVVQSNILIDTAAEMTDAIVVDKSTFTGPNGLEPGRLVLERIEFSCSGLQLLLEFDHTADDPIAILEGQGFLDFSRFDNKYQGFIDPASAGATGDIVVTTLTAAVGDKASMLLFLRLKD